MRAAFYGARAFRQVKTPLQKNIDFVIRVLVFLASQLGILLALSAVVKGLPVVESVQVAAVIVSLVPMHDLGGGSRTAQLAMELVHHGFHVTFVSLQETSEGAQV